MSNSFWPHGLQHARLPCPSPTAGACSNSCPLSWWCYLTISSSAALFSCLQSFPASGSFAMSWLFPSGGQSLGTSASVLPMNIQDWFPLGLTGWISLQSKGLSRVFSSTTVQKHQSLYTTFSSCLSFENWKIKPHFQVAVDTSLVVKNLTFCIWNSDAFLPIETICWSSGFCSCGTR